MRRKCELLDKDGAGFTIVEIVVVLMVLALLIWVVAGTYGATGRSRELALAEGKTVQEAIRAFALNNGHLPCPDIDGKGFEARSGAACSTTTPTGWVPYRSLGLEQPSDRDRYAYGIYRSATNDLTATGLPLRNLISILQTAISLPVDNKLVYLTGDGAAQGAVDCTNNQVSNPAFVIVAPLEDRDGDGNTFDGIHSGLPATGLCVQSPATASTLAQDDVVISESLSSLMGWLSARAS